MFMMRFQKPISPSIKRFSTIKIYAYKRKVTPRRLMNNINRILYKINDDPLLDAMLSESSTIAGIQLSMVIMYGILYMIDVFFFADERRKKYSNKL